MCCLPKELDLQLDPTLIIFVQGVVTCPVRLLGSSTRRIFADLLYLDCRNLGGGLIFFVPHLVEIL